MHKVKDDIIIVRVEEDVKLKLDRIAELKDITLSAYVRELFYAALKAEGKNSQ